MDAVQTKTRWFEIGALESIPRLGARVVKSPQGDIAVFRTRTDEVFALDDACPHRGGPLSQGIVHGRQVTCPLHAWCIGLADGRAVAPDEGQVRRYPVEVRDGKIYLSLEAL
jgi:nitrite reductase (NADH) small subunit